MFEFLFKYSPTVFRKGEFVFASGWPVWLLAALVLLAGGGLAWYLHRNRSWLRGRQPVALWSLQLGTVALVLVMLWQPGCSIESLRADQNLVAVLVDTSRSMGLAEDEQTRLEKATAALGTGLNRGDPEEVPGAPLWIRGAARAIGIGRNDRRGGQQ